MDPSTSGAAATEAPVVAAATPVGGAESDASVVPPRRRRRRALRWIAAGLALTLLAVGGLTLRWFVWPASSTPRSVDAIVVLGGGLGERYRTGMELRERGVSNVLVFSTGLRANRYREMDNVWDLCDQGTDEFEVHCLVAMPDDTRGEALSISALARAEGWHSIALVTTDHHMERAARWFDRCFDGKVYRVPASAPTSFDQVVHEWAGMIQTLVLERSCSA